MDGEDLDVLSIRLYGLTYQQLNRKQRRHTDKVYKES